MEIDLFGRTEPDYLDSGYAKFVLSDRKERGLTLTIAGLRVEHRDLLVKAAEFVGAGMIYNNTVKPDYDPRREEPYEVQWGSQTCRKDCGYDRPLDPGEANRVLAEIKEKIIEWDKARKK